MNQILRNLSAALLLVAPLAACGSDQAEGAAGGATDARNESLAAALADADGLSRLSGSLNETAMATIFDGTASYTILAPTDAAFDKAALSAQEGESAYAVLAAVLREHVLPGAFTVPDIARALQNDGSVEMQNMGGTMLTFAKEGDAIRVTDEDGGTALITGDAIVASNGVAIPVDAMLKTP
ncbi:fasciclin domain-containing protein [uncultured Croceicoccus sp.]|uniref:fasciclin domain-containing protein n=1 Tax=uncultured Croceicoccus sp. TaxID=1295329 RepID=UPI0026337353|nr:fasciclin domain-containing protein [uncultured Croceicoccus sp.]